MLEFTRHLAQVAAFAISGLTVVTSAASDCHTRLVTAYAEDHLPADMRALCTPANEGRTAWLAKLKLGNRINRARYRDLLRIADDFDAVDVINPLAARQLPAILAQTATAIVAPASWFERLRTAVARWFERHDQKDLRWLNDLLERLAVPSWLAELFLRVGVVLSLVAALYLILREVELSGGVRPGRRQRVRAAAVPANADNSAAPLPWDRVMAIPGPARPAAIWRWLLAELMARELLPRDASLTHREQVALLRAIRPALGAGFGMLVNDIEPCLFGRQPPPASALAGLVERVAAFAAVARAA